MSLAQVTKTDARDVTSDEPDVRAIAKDLLSEHNGVAEAVAALEAMCDEDHTLYRAVVNGHFHSLCSTVIRNAARAERDRIDSPPPARAENHAAWAEAISAALMDYPIYGGRRIGDCNRQELLTGANSYRTQADDMLVKARWLRLVADKLPDDRKTVRQALKEDTLAALRQQARDAARAA
jgi:hypothetical protein